MRAWLLVFPLLAACGKEPARPEPGVRQARQQAASELVSKTPVPRTYRYTSGEMLVLDVPSADKYGFLQTNRCFVWRDADAKSSSISCAPTELLFEPRQPSPRD